MKNLCPFPKFSKGEIQLLQYPQQKFFPEEGSGHSWSNPGTTQSSKCKGSNAVSLSIISFILPLLHFFVIITNVYSCFCLSSAPPYCDSSFLFLTHLRDTRWLVGVVNFSFALTLIFKVVTSRQIFLLVNRDSHCGYRV